MQAGGVGRREVARGDDMRLGRLADAFRLGAEQLSSTRPVTSRMSDARYRRKSSSIFSKISM